MKIIFYIFFAVMVLSVSCNAFASVIVNGYLDDWGVTPGAYGPDSQWEPYNGIYHIVEDQNTPQLVPGWGGQQYDAEALYAKKEGSTIYLALVTGMRPSGYQWMPGDIYFDFGQGKSYGLKTTDTTVGNIIYQKGTLYKNPLWNTSPYWGGSTDPTDMVLGTGTEKGLSEFVYEHTYYDDTSPIDYTNDHYVIEAAIPASYFGDDWYTGGIVHWTQTCGNDAIDLPIPRTPEPATALLFGLGALGYGVIRKRRG